ncbi:hypothetical protein CY34DRAFT_809192 [Suillus luteus UH-Slu-Lm8-n1]|uniref:Unplaced genomic scaffold CY34scaffold_253, whole genome shotgun sequence n=1 Tax=Suillus luteus UH-Slu-Lm8-n1 TaxID=930992 RepID=A0A0D0AW39_9AGAM|nr:hypothetical protein CY34DRAFT_809192 [Suillus luteus UH-Slu-Lm8-n1]
MAHCTVLILHRASPFPPCQLSSRQTPKTSPQSNQIQSRQMQYAFAARPFICYI